MLNYSDLVENNAAGFWATLPRPPEMTLMGRAPPQRGRLVCFEGTPSSEEGKQVPTTEETPNLRYLEAVCLGGLEFKSWGFIHLISNIK